MTVYSSLKGKGLLFLALLWFLWLLIMLLRTIIPPFLPLVEDEFAISHAKAAGLVSLGALGSSITLFTSGMLAGFVGYKRAILCSFAAATVVMLMIPHVETFSHLAGLVFVLGLATGVYFPASIPVVTEHFAPRIWGRALAIHDTGASLAVFAAPLITVLFLKFLTWRQFFYVFAAAQVISGTLFLIFGKEVKVKRKLGGYLSAVLKRKSLWVLGSIWAFAAGSYLAVYLVMPLYLVKELSFDLDHANTILGLSRLGGTVFAVIMGFMVDRFDLRRSMLCIFVATGLSTLLISHSNLTVVQTGLFLQGTVATGFFPVGLMAISRMFTTEERSVAGGIVSTFGGLFGMTLFPYLLGLSGDYISFRFGIFVFGLLVIAASGLVRFLRLPTRGEQAWRTGIVE